MTSRHLGPFEVVLLVMEVVETPPAPPGPGAAVETVRADILPASCSASQTCCHQQSGAKEHAAVPVETGHMGHGGIFSCVLKI